MFIVISIMFAGVAAGYILRNRKFTQKLERPIFFTIIALLFLMGVYVGANDEIVRNLGKLGGQAFLITAFSVTGTLIAAKLLEKYLLKDRKKKEADDER